MLLIRKTRRDLSNISQHRATWTAQTVDRLGPVELDALERITELRARDVAVAVAVKLQEM